MDQLNGGVTNTTPSERQPEEKRAEILAKLGSSLSAQTSNNWHVVVQVVRGRLLECRIHAIIQKDVLSG